MTKIKLALFASGSGSNAINIIDHFSNHPSIEIGFLLSNKKEAPIVEKAQKKGVKVLVFSNDEVADGNFLSQVCLDNDIQYIVLAGYLRKIPVELLQNYSEKMINLHPALLPKFGGQGMYGNNVHKAVVEAKETETGITIHFVNEHFDKGRKIAQFYCALNQTDTFELVQAKVQNLEHAYFPIVIEKTILAN